MLAPEEYEAQLAFVQAALPELDAEHCRHVYYEVARRDICKALHYLIQPERPIEALLEQWQNPALDAAARQACLRDMLHHYCPNDRFQTVVHGAARYEPLPVTSRVLQRLQQYQRAPRAATLEQWWAGIAPNEEALALYLLEELRYYSRALEPSWAVIDRYAQHANPSIARAALELLVRLPGGVARSMGTLQRLLRQPERQLHALQALQHARGLSAGLVQALVHPIVQAYQQLERQEGHPNNLSGEYALARNIARNNGVPLTITNLNLGRS